MLKKYISLIIIGVIPILSMAQFSHTKTDTAKVSTIQLNEVVVKATKNNLKVKDLPTSVTILPKSVIETNEVKSLVEITGLTPNLVMPDYGSKLTSPIYIRGIGSRINSPSVGLYVDGVPYFEKSAFQFDFFEVESVEVLRGPQGTLYGRNSMGGLIYVTTKSPLNYQGTYLKVGAGNYGNYNVSATHYHRFNNKFAASLSLNYRKSNGFYENKYTSENVGKLNSYSLNNKLIYQISKHLTLENIFSMEMSKQAGYPYALYNDSLSTTMPINYNQESLYDRKLINDALKLKYTQADWELTNVLSFQFLDGKQQVDQDFTPNPIYFFQYHQKQQMFSNELVLKSKSKSKYQWLFGGFIFRQTLNNDLEADIYPMDMWSLRIFKPINKGAAVFHQSTYQITQSLSVVGGLRYDKEAAILEYHKEARKGEMYLPKSDTLYPILSENILLPKIAVNYKFRNTSLYASYTTGYKSGGFNEVFEKPEHLMFKHEKSFNYEVGMKGAFINHLIYMDAALFYTKLKNQQIYRTVPSGRGSYLENAGLSENKGFEFSLNSKQYKGFSMMLAYGYTDSKILEYVKDSTTNYNNNFTPYIPKHTLAVQLNHTILIHGILFLDKIQWNVLYNVRGVQYWNLENTYKENSYGLLNAKVSFVKNNIKLDFWGKNLLNEEYNTFLFTIKQLHNTYAQQGKPFQVGVNFSITF